MNRSTTITAIAAAALVALAGTAGAAQGWTLPSWIAPHKDTQVAAAPATLAPAAPVVAAAASLPNFRAIVAAEGPAVVGVTVAGMHPAEQTPFGNSDNEDPFLRFFRGIPGLTLPPPGPQPFRGLGSGFIVSPDGVILTNAHVVRDARQVTVKLSDRREFAAKVLGSDPMTDIAVLKVDAKGLPTVTLGDARNIQVGDWVLAIGAPYGFSQTATQGIVSAKGRSLPGDSAVPFIQTDAAINPGNSGGPLFDASGRVIGINAQIWSQSGGFQGLAFSIPINVAMNVEQQILAHGKVEHARLGVSIQDLSAPLAASFGLKAPDGALVSSVVPGSAAAHAGLKPGDVITAIDGQPVQTAGDVSSRIGLAHPGEHVTLQLWRDKSRSDVSVTLGRVDGARQTAAAAPETPSLGVMLRPLDRDELRRAGVDHGLLIEGVSGPAQMAGVQPGDVLLAINGQPVHRVEQVRDALRKHPAQVALLIDRDGQQIFVPINLG